MMKSIMRDHGVCQGGNTRSETPRKHFDPTQSWTELNVCMHYGFGPIRGTRTSNSLLVQLSDDDIEIWVTGIAFIISILTYRHWSALYYPI